MQPPVPHELKSSDQFPAGQVPAYLM